MVGERGGRVVCGQQRGMTAWGVGMHFTESMGDVESDALSRSSIFCPLLFVSDIWCIENDDDLIVYEVTIGQLTDSMLEIIQYLFRQ